MASPSWALALCLAVHAVVGVILGGLHFGGLWWNTRLFAIGGRAWSAIVVLLARISLLGGVLTVISFEGAAPLLATALGVVLARSLVTRRIARNTV
ncbi:ATP synthase subunit I [Lichenihabitans psoromatis]|uniref:ATP synthase subunit I n=1 Tax=Lichenihabitans psoromatis TaxID=2528642 RepID=UPI001036724E|nr:ATP synthase subunit I [Lichenihabitans psoromatis]